MSKDTEDDRKDVLNTDKHIFFVLKTGTMFGIAAEPLISEFVISYSGFP